jgi:putative SOS response-associated peptidase YedK
VAPTKPVYAVLTRAAKSAAVARGDDPPGNAEDGGQPERELRVLRWGLVPSWAKDQSIGSRLINARAETVAAKPSFRRAFACRRCLLPADGFYEWIPVTDQGRTVKQPYYIHRADGGTLAFAGVYELWRDPAVPDDDADPWLWSAAIITTSATDDVGRIHDRMPMVIEPARWADWLDPARTEPGALQYLLQPAVSGGLASYPVSTAVNSVRNNGPELITPLNPDELPATLTIGALPAGHPHPPDWPGPSVPEPSGTGPHEGISGKPSSTLF